MVNSWPNRLEYFSLLIFLPIEDRKKREFIEKFFETIQKNLSSLLTNTYQAKVNDKVSTTIGDNIITNLKD